MNINHKLQGKKELAFLKSPEKWNHLSCAWWVHLAVVTPEMTPGDSLVPCNAPHAWGEHGGGADQSPRLAVRCLTCSKVTMWFSMSWIMIVASTRSIHRRDVFRKICRYYAGTSATCRLLNKQRKKGTAQLLLICSSRSSLNQSKPTTLENNLWALKPRQTVYILLHQGRGLIRNKHRH